MSQTLNINLTSQIKVLDPTALNAASSSVVATVFDDPNVITISENFDYAFYDSRSILLMEPVAGSGVLDSILTITGLQNYSISLVAGGTAGSELVVFNGLAVTVHIEDGVSTQQQICDALLDYTEDFFTAVAATPGAVWTLGVGTDKTVLTGAVVAFKVFDPPFKTIKLLMMEVTDTRKVNLTLTDEDGEKEIKDVEKFVIMFGAFTEVKVEAQEDQTYVKLLMIGNNL